MLAEILEECGMEKKVAKVLSFLAEVKEATSRDIEINTGLRQPEVSVTIKSLNKLGYITVSEERRHGKGRPYKVYKLSKDIKEIISEFIEKKREEINELEEKLKKLEEEVKKY